MIKAVLFDIDNTLILFDENLYFKSYVSQIARYFADIMPVEVFNKRLICASQELLNNNGELSNAEYYMNYFAKDYELHRENLWNRFKLFYEQEYDQFQSLVTVPDEVPEVIQALSDQKIKLVIASNPMFPENVQIKRVAWAGIAHFDYALITHIENMSFCKPRLDYYQQICSIIGEAPESCLMVGNDPVNDMIVTKIGMKTYLTTDSDDYENSGLTMSRELRNNTEITDITPDFRGKIRDVPQIVERVNLAN